MCSTRCARSSARSGRVPLIGFAGSPFTLACYMIEGAGSSDFATVRRMAHGRPDLLQRLVAVNARAVAAYLNEQIRGRRRCGDAIRHVGRVADDRRLPRVLARFDASGAGGVAPRHRTGESIPAIVFTKGGGQWLDSIADVRRRSASDSTGRSISPLRAAASGDRVALQGNLDPLVLLADADAVAREATAVVRAAGAAPGHIFNLGHGIVPATPPDNVAVLVETVHRESRALPRGT